MTSLVEDIRARIDERLAELAPLVAEHEQLMRLRSQLDDRLVPRAPRRPRRETRADESLALVSARPGITTNEIAHEMGIDRNYLYRVLPRLEKEGLLRRRDGGWHVAGR